MATDLPVTHWQLPMLEHHGMKFPYYEQTYTDGTVCDLTGVYTFPSCGMTVPSEGSAFELGIGGVLYC